MNKNILLAEVSYKATRSGGPGGQHANKANTRVELYWTLEDSVALSPSEKDRLRVTLANRLNKDGQLILSTGRTRSQATNKELVTEKFLRMLHKRAQRPKKRKKTRPSKAAKRRRVENKRRHSEKKANRRKPKLPPR